MGDGLKNWKFFSKKTGESFCGANESLPKPSPGDPHKKENMEKSNDKNLTPKDPIKVIKTEKNILIAAICCMAICFVVNMANIIINAMKGNNLWIIFLICEIIDILAILFQVFALIKINKTLKRILKRENETLNVNVKFSLSLENEISKDETQEETKND